MRVFTFGWDFPPMKNGGLGVACFGLTRELVGKGVEVLFVLPKRQNTIGEPTFIFADKEEKVRVSPVESSLVPYQSTDTYIESVEYDTVTGCRSHVGARSLKKFTALRIRRHSLRARRI
jgi:hypothetical protein